ncbi:MAG TPA: 30S ribosomal protein S16 [Candidatus Paceibacterota bacterium]
MQAPQQIRPIEGESAGGELPKGALMQRYARTIDLFMQSGMLAPLMLMMRLQRVGRKNDPSFRIVVTDKRTGPKSDKHIDRLGSYNPKMNHVQLDAAKAKEWLAKGVQPSDTVHNILVGQKVIEGKKKNVLPKKSPIIDEAAIKRAEEEAKAKAEAEAKAQADAEAAAAPAEEVAEAAPEAPAEEATEEPA